MTAAKAAFDIVQASKTFVRKFCTDQLDPLWKRGHRADLIIILLLLLWGDLCLLLGRFAVDDAHLILVESVQVLLFGRDHDRDFVLVVRLDDTEIFARFV